MILRYTIRMRIKIIQVCGECGHPKEVASIFPIMPTTVGGGGGWRWASGSEIMVGAEMRFTDCEGNEHEISTTMTITLEPGDAPTLPDGQYGR